MASEQQQRVGKRMEAAAESRGLAPMDVAVKLGVTPTTVYRWYKGSRPGPGLMEAFAGCVGVPVSHFYGEAATPERSALSILVAWAERLMEGESLRPEGVSEEDLTPLEWEGLRSHSGQFRDDLLRASHGLWPSLTSEQRAAVLDWLIRERLGLSGEAGASPQTERRRGRRGKR